MHNGEVVLHTLYRGQVDTIICTYLINCANFYTLSLPHLRESFHFNPPHLLLQSILVRLCHRFLHIPFPCQVNSLLFPPPHPHLYLFLPLRRLTEVQKRSRINIRSDLILPFPNVCIHWLKPCLRSCRLLRGVLPLPI